MLDPWRPIRRPARARWWLFSNGDYGAVLTGYSRPEHNPDGSVRAYWFRCLRPLAPGRPETTVPGWISAAEFGPWTGGRDADVSEVPAAYLRATLHWLGSGLEPAA